MDYYEILEELFIDCFETNNLILDLIKIGKKANKKTHWEFYERTIWVRIYTRKKTRAYKDFTYASKYAILTDEKTNIFLKRLFGDKYEW